MLKLPQIYKDEALELEPAEGLKLQSILLDLSLYEHESLVTKALNLVLRHMRPMSQVHKAIENVQLLTNEHTIKIFNEMESYSSRLRDILADNQVSVEDIPPTQEILTKMIGYLKKANGKL